MAVYIRRKQATHKAAGVVYFGLYYEQSRMEAQGLGRVNRAYY
jgi:hypothetical protein